MLEFLRDQFKTKQNKPKKPIQSDNSSGMGPEHQGSFFFFFPNTRYCLSVLLGKNYTTGAMFPAAIFTSVCFCWGFVLLPRLPRTVILLSPSSWGAALLSPHIWLTCKFGTHRAVDMWGVLCGNSYLISKNLRFPFMTIDIYFVSKGVEYSFAHTFSTISLLTLGYGYSSLIVNPTSLSFGFSLEELGD
jgi:hypothetical protein